MPSVFYTRQILPGYPKTHLPVQTPYLNCKTHFQLKIDTIYGLEENLLFISKDNNTLLQINHDKTVNPSLDQKIEDEDFVPICHVEFNHERSIDLDVIDKILSDQISQLNGSRNTHIRTDTIYESDINTGEDMKITNNWSNDNLNLLLNINSSLKNPPILEFLLQRMKIGEKIRIFCTSDYFSSFELRYNLNDISNHESIYPSHEINRNFEENFNESGYSNTNDTFKILNIKESNENKTMTNQQFISKFIILDIELNLFDLPEDDCVEEAKKYKEIGNKFFIKGNLEESIDNYIKGKRFVEDVNKFDNIEYKNLGIQVLSEILLNIAAIFLKNKNANNVIEHTSEVIKFFPTNENPYIQVKALFRRAQGKELNEEYESAIKDCELALQLQPLNGPVLTLLKELKKKRLLQRGKEKSFFSGFFKKDEGFNDTQISQKLLKRFKTENQNIKLSLDVIFRISEYCGFEFIKFAIINKNFKKIVDDDEWWMLVSLREKYYNPNKDPPVVKWKDYFKQVYSSVRKIYLLPRRLRQSTFEDVSELYRGGNNYFFESCKRIVSYLGETIQNEDRLVYEALKELSKYWTYNEIFKIYEVQADLGKLNNLDDSLRNIKEKVVEYYDEYEEEKNEKFSNNLLSKINSIENIDDAFNLLMQSNWDTQGIFPMLMRCVYVFYNIQPKSMKMGFYCSDGFLALILRDNRILKDETIIKWFQ